MIKLKHRKWIILAATVFITADVLITLAIWPAIRPSALSDIPETQSGESLLASENLESLAETIVVSETAESAAVSEETPDATVETAGETQAPATPAPKTTTTREPDPLELADHWYDDIPQEQALALFAAIDNVSDLITNSGRCENISFYAIPRAYGLLVFRALSEKRGVNVYWYCDNFTSGQLELRLCDNNDNRQYTVLASKPLPVGYTVLEAYDKLTRVSRPGDCLSQALLDQILAAGNIYPFIARDGSKLSGSHIISDDGQVICFSYYMPETRMCINIYEDYNTREMYYSLSQVPDTLRFLEEPYEKRIPLSPDADINDY